MARLTATHPELKPFATKSVELLTPIRAFNLLARVTEEDAILVWMDASFGRPDSLVMWTVPYRVSNTQRDERFHKFINTDASYCIIQVLFFLYPIHHHPKI